MSDNESQMFWSLIVCCFLLMVGIILLSNVAKERDLLKSQIEVYQRVCDEASRAK